MTADEPSETREQRKRRLERERQRRRRARLKAGLVETRLKHSDADLRAALEGEGVISPMAEDGPGILSEGLRELVERAIRRHRGAA